MRLGNFEAMYETLFAETIETGEITAEERERLNLAAAALGLDGKRVQTLESALIAACEARADVTLVDPEDPSTLADRAPPSEHAPPSEEGRETERRLTPAKQASMPYLDDEAPTLARPSTPKKTGEAQAFPELHGRYHAAARKGDVDAQFTTAAVLVRRKAATLQQHEIYQRFRAEGPIRPARPVSADNWASQLSHPEEDRITGEILAVIASAALIGRVTAMRRDGTLPKLDADKLQDPATSTVSAVRALAWAAATLGMRAPPIYIAPELDTGFEIVTAVPPSSRVGARMLSGQSSQKLAFYCARHLSWYREEHFVATLVPSVPYLEDIFLAALSLGASNIEIPPDIAPRAKVIAEAMRPCLEKPQIERLRRLVARFLARGGVANLKKWARAADWTGCRAGLLLCGDLETACEIVANESRSADRVKELENFWASDQATALRRQLGIAIA